MHSPRVALIVFDAAQADILLSLADEGRAPTIDHLRSTAAWGPTQTPEGLLVGAVFPTLYTGCSPAAHGRYCFRQHRPGTYEVHPTDARLTTQRPAFWEHLSRSGVRCAAIDLPHTAVYDAMNGLHLVDWGSHDGNPVTTSSDPSFLDELREFGDHPIPTHCNGDRRTAEDHQELLDQLLNGVERRVALCELVLDREPWDVFVTAFSESHCVGHQAWSVHDPAHPYHDPVVASAIGDPVLAVYERLDAALGRLIEQFDESTTVFVLASHGMGPRYTGNHLLDEVLQRIDMTRSPATTRALAAVDRWARARTPQPLRQLRRRLRGGKVSAPGLRQPPGNVASVIPGAARRHYFGVPNNDTYGAVRLNVVGREPAGRVRADQIDEVERSLSDSLLAIQNLDTGRAAVRRVLRTRDLYDGPLLDTLPDLLIEWDWSAPVSRLASPEIGVVEEVDTEGRTGDHRPGGLLFVRGPGVRPQMFKRRIPTEDIAPAVAAVVGVELPDVDGVPIPEIASAHAPRA